MKRAIVLSGGGGKGAYQIGFWKAIRQLQLDYDIVTGTSIGALNGVFMVQGNYKDAVKLWNSIDYDKIIDSDNPNNIFSKDNSLKKVSLKYAKGAVKGGYDVPGLKKAITDNLKYDLFYNSKKDYGLVTVKFPSLKPVMLSKKEIPKEFLVDYLLASSACFPAFKKREINNESYIDGGYYDNIPIDLAIKLGADEVIAVDLRAPGKRKSIKQFNIPIKIISSKNDIGHFLIIEKKQARRLMKLGYNDTMKAFNELDGNIYTFIKKTLDRNYNKYQEKFFNNLDTYITKKDAKGIYKKILSKNKKIYFNEILEECMSAFLINDERIYTTTRVNILLRKNIRQYKPISVTKIRNIIKNDKLSKNFISKEIIMYIFELIKVGKSKRIIKSLSLIFPNSFLCAIYLKTITNK